MLEFANLDWPEIIGKLESFATSELARAKLHDTKCCASIKEAEVSVAQTIEIQTIVRSGRRCFMESLDLCSLWQQRLAKGATLKTLELKDVRHFCVETMALKETLHDYPLPWLKEQFSSLMEASEPLSAIDQIMTPEGDIRNDASEKLFKLFREKANQTKALHNLLDKLAKKADMEPILQERYVTTREGRWVLPVKSGMQHFFDGLIHASSQSKQTVFMEPKEIIPLNNRLREIDVEIEEEIERLLTDLSKYLCTRLDELIATRDILLNCDVKFAQAQLALHLSASPCQFDNSCLRLLDVRHPLLVLSQSGVIANSVELDPSRRLLLLSGPNAGGKTVLLKSVGLAAQMARCGLMICAEEGSKMPFFKQLHVAVGDAQSVDAHLSTFAAHLNLLQQAAGAKGHECLLLIDEICGSTDPEEGSALARAFIERFAENKVFGVITSHLGPLKLGWSKDSGVMNGSLEYDSKTSRPTYQFIMGVPGQSLAIQTAKRVGVDEKLITRALDHLSPQMKNYQLGLAEIEDMKSEIRELKERLAEENAQARQAKNKFLALQQKFDSEKQRMLEQALKRAERKIDTLIEHSKVDDIFRRHQTLEKAKDALPEVVKASSRVQSTIPKIDSPEDFAKAFPPGAKVFAPTMGRDAVIQGAPNARGEVPILSNSMRLVVPWDQLRPPQRAENPTRDLLRKSHETSLRPTELDREIDVRGLSVDEALRVLESQLDRASLNSEDRVKVIHGHGTETLKRAVRNYLSRSLYVKKWRVGTPETGGDGITWVEIKD